MSKILELTDYETEVMKNLIPLLNMIMHGLYQGHEPKKDTREYRVQSMNRILQALVEWCII